MGLRIFGLIFLEGGGVGHILCGNNKCWANIKFLGYPSNKDIHVSFICWIRILYFLFLKNLDILVRYQIFTFFNLTQISMFLGIYHLFIILLDSNINFLNINSTNYVGCQIISWGKKSSKDNILFLKRESFVINFYIQKQICKKIINEFKKKI
jgi:hypothetical protein